MAEMIQIIKNNCLAKALYDNHAESPEELEFQKGDVLTVLEQNPNGLQGWWLCALRGRQGIAPGNRLRLMPYMYDPTGLGFATGVVAHNVAMTSSAPHNHIQQCPAGLTVTGCTTLPNRGSNANRRPPTAVGVGGPPAGARVVLPVRHGDVFVYDTPQVGMGTGGGGGLSGRSEYDVPAVATLPRANLHTRDGILVQTTPKLQTFAVPSTQSQNYDEPKPSSKLSGNGGCQYDIPRGINQHFRGMSLSDGQYDFPQAQGAKAVNGTAPEAAGADHAEYDAPAARSAVAPLKAASLYDKPPNQQQQTHQKLDMSTFKEKCPSYDVPVASAVTNARMSFHSQGSSSGVTGSQSSLNTSLSSGGGSNRSSLEQQAEEAYDIPQLGHKRPTGGLDTTPTGLLKIASATGRASGNSVYDTPPQVTRDIPVPSNFSMEAAEYVSLPPGGGNTSVGSNIDPPSAREAVPLELHSSLEALVIHQQEVQAAAQLLFASLAATSQTQSQTAKESRESMRVPCHTLLNSVRGFFTFARGAVNSARSNAPDTKMVAKIERLVQTLATSYSVIADACAAMDKLDWQCHNKQGERDDFDRLVACARSLTDDVQQISLCVQGNATLIFRRTPPAQEIRQRPLPRLPSTDGLRAGQAADTTDGKEPDYSEYDYIQMQNETPIEKTGTTAELAPQHDFGAHYDSLLKRSQEMIADKSTVAEVPAHVCNDHMLREYYSPRLNDAISYLSESISAFLAAIEKNRPPRIFVEHTKFVLIAAHRVACIGDTLHRHLADHGESEKFRRCSEKISTSLRLLVDTTKRAALHFPAVVAIQEMVDTVMAVSHLCHALKGCFVVNTPQLQQAEQQQQQQLQTASSATPAGMIVN
ncbi:embryonal Fyn-associated substrate-like isoform X4 [Varroa jacobsoni]|uniref:SH3 domain-containing protein n=1 Tax=Varroa destructor TaxID=109461 RepID=A0A7M7M9K9_VARDE|nr:embryonal Fyn-associated substrate-like isoform X4 [Varroa destructor]XP_022701585.1 embryonal Fyn-associated substrate-like isoform X4 [Varroa jacobsoni]